jgi:hypothetical protein
VGWLLRRLFGAAPYLVVERNSGNRHHRNDCFNSPHKPIAPKGDAEDCLSRISAKLSDEASSAGKQMTDHLRTEKSFARGTVWR